MNQFKFTVYGRLPGTNEYTAALNSNRHEGARMKAEAQSLIGWYIKTEWRRQGCPRFSSCEIAFSWIEPNSRRDLDNIRFGAKFILDALQQFKVIENDNQKVVKKLTDTFGVDAKNPRIVIEIKEV